MTEGFQFVDAGRTFICSVGPLNASRPGAWWWFKVSTDDRHRYAPFQQDAADTEWSVRTRIVAYYDDLLARRAAPATSYWRRGAPKAATPAPAATVVEPGAQPE